MNKEFRMALILVTGSLILAISMGGILLGILSRPSVPTTAADEIPPGHVLIGERLIRLEIDEGRRVEMVSPPPVEAIVVPEVADEPPPEPVEIEPTLPPAAVEPVIIIRYTVQPNDNLYDIARRQNSSIELMALYNIADDDLQPGNVLDLPIANPDYCPGERAYVVREKDTVFRLAYEYGSTVEAIRERNNLPPDSRINAAQVICIP